MHKCPKCSSQYGDDLKICRTCGAILEAVVEEPPHADDIQQEADFPPSNRRHGSARNAVNRCQSASKSAGTVEQARTECLIRASRQNRKASLRHGRR